MKKMILVLFLLSMNVAEAQEIHCRDVLNILTNYQTELENNDSKMLIEKGIQKIQQRCQQRQRGHYEQQQPTQQQAQSEYIELYKDQVYEIEMYNLLLFCEGEQNRELAEKIRIGYCLDPHRRVSQQRQQRQRCDYRSLYLKKGESYTMGNAIYYCRN